MHFFSTGKIDEDLRSNHHAYGKPRVQYFRPNICHEVRLPMKKAIVVFSLVLLGSVIVLSLSGGGITGQALSLVTGNWTDSLQVGVVLLAAIGILGITLLNLTHKDE